MADMQMDYSSIRAIHLTSVALSITLFALRGLLQLASFNWRQWRLLRLVPHLNDTVLLTAAIALSYMSGQYPLAQPWLTAKIIALFFYIAAGSIALRENVHIGHRRIAFALALLAVLYIVGVAWKRSPTLALF